MIFYAMSSVALLPVSSYEAELRPAVDGLFSAASVRFTPGSRVLVKPNLVAPMRAELSTTHPAVVEAVCAHLLDAGARPFVADSPAFASATVVARRTGLDARLKRLGVPLTTLGAPVAVRLSHQGCGPSGGCIGVSRTALEADRIVSLPRLKVHNQLLITLAVKNLFGCVVGARKAFAHATHGDRDTRFESMLLDVFQALPPSVALLDGIAAMHVKGPTGGEPYPAGLLAASDSPVALDSAVCAMLGIGPQDNPLWAEAARRALPGAILDEIGYPLASPAAFAFPGFRLPERLSPVTFHPVRLALGRVKSLVLRLRG